MTVVIRPYASEDYAEWRRMRTALWPSQTEDDMAAWRARTDTAIIVAVRRTGSLCGFVEVGERTNADGCESSGGGSTTMCAGSGSALGSSRRPSHSPGRADIASSGRIRRHTT